MYCGKCGKFVADSAMYCSNCGESTKNMLKTDVVSQNNNIKRRTKKKMKMAVAAIMAIIVAFVGVRIFINFTSVEKLALRACKADIEGNVNTYYKLLSPQYRAELVGDHQWFSTEEDFKERLMEQSEDFQNQMKARCGEKIKITYEIDEIRKCERKDQLGFIKSELNRDYDYDPDEIKDAEVIVVRIYARGTDGWGEWTSEMACIKVGFKWYIHRPGFRDL